MNPELITRVVNLVQKSGDKVVLADPVSGKAVVVMDLDVYECLMQASTMTEPSPEPQPAPMPVATVSAQPAPAPVQVAAPVYAPAPAPAPAPAYAAAPSNAPHIESIYEPEPLRSAPAPAAPAYRPQPITPPAPPVRGPVTADQLASAFGIPPSGAKKAQPSAKNEESSAPKKGIKVTPETMGTTHVMADLTQEQLIDKINRDIGAWKTAQETRRTDELRAAVTQNSQPEHVNALEEEERFFLEPIE